ncbi:MAG TPA: response regulator [Cytophagales bacterium]|jgi:DNA-binding response OmpR family regulator
MNQQSFHQATILILCPAIIIGQGLKWQFEQWGFTHVELVTTPQRLLQAAQATPPALILLDADLEGEMNCFVLARRLQREDNHVPALFITKAIPQPRFFPANQFISFPHGWLPKPCYAEALWQQVRLLLPDVEREQDQQQG